MSENKKGNGTEPWDFRDFNGRSQEISGVLRTWLVAYGIGAPVLFFSTPDIRAAVKTSGHAHLVIFLFFSGVATQVLNAFLNKWLTWFRSEVLLDSENNNKWLYRTASEFHKAIWPDIVVDIYTIFAFGVATYVSVLALIN